MVKEQSDWLILGESLNGYIRTEVLTAACELGLFNYLHERGAAGLEEVARHCGISEQGARILLLGCREAGLVESREDGSHRNTPVASTYLVEGAPYCMLAFVRFTREVQQKTCYHFLESLREHKATGLRALGHDDTKTLYEAFSSDKRMEDLFHAAMAEYSKMSALDADAEELREVKRLLDLGGGNGTVLSRIAARNPGLQGTLFDLPTVAAKALENFRRNGLADRVGTNPGDIFRDPFPRGYDGILISHFVEIFEPERIRQVYGKAFEALEPGGRLFLWTIAADDDEAGPLQAVKSSVYFVAAAGGNGMAYPGRDHRRWLTEAGFEVVKEKRYPENCHSFFVARKG